MTLDHIMLTVGAVSAVLAVIAFRLAYKFSREDTTDA